MIPVTTSIPVLVLLLLSFGSAQADCRLTESGTARVTGIPDGRTLLLEDGREIVLAGLEAAPAYPAARQNLQNRLAGQSVMLKGLSVQPDRYGRLSGYAVAAGADNTVQYDLLREGSVRMAGPVDQADCRAAMLAQEKAARVARVGLWGDPVYEIHKAESPAAILGARGRFVLVEGQVLSVRESGGTIYVNFGRRWSEDFTATIPKRLASRFTSAGLAPQSLSGRAVRIRGVVEERGGPWIETIRPDQIEFTASPQQRPQPF